MEERNVTMRQALDTLRNGKIVSGPTLDEYGEWRVTLRKRSAGRPTRVAVAIKEGGRNLTVVTVIRAVGASGKEQRWKGITIASAVSIMCTC